LQIIITMKLIITLLALTVFLEAQAQYYYKDIIANKETNELNSRLKKAKVVDIKVKSLEFDNNEVEDFLCEQNIENNGKHMITVTGSPYIGENHLHSFFTAQSQIIRSVDSNPTIIIQNNYDYIENRLNKIIVTSFEVDNKKDKSVEVHEWIYNKNVPEKMYLIKNGNDTTTIKFLIDTTLQLPVEEISYYKGKEKERYYYYYDSKKRLTDVTRYHPYARKVLPEFIFEYDEQNNVKRKTSFTTGTKDYQIWHYAYNENGLKTEDQCFLRGNVFRGKLMYRYTYE
jgi:hypothetical protein